MTFIVHRALPVVFTARRNRLLGVALLGVTGMLTGCGQGDDATPTTVAQSTGATTTTTTTPVITVTPPVVTTPTTSPVTTSPITTTPITTTPTAPDCSTVTPSTPGIVDGCGNISATAYRAMAPELGSDQGITYRYGSSGACSVADGNKSLPTWSRPADKFASIQGVWGITYQLGGPQSLLYDNYYDNMGQAVFVADDSSHPGVTQLMTVAFGQNVFSFSPQLPWTNYGGGDPDPNIVIYAKTATLSKPIAAARCNGNDNWCAESLTVYPNGFIGAAGSYTAHNVISAQLPAGKVPTAIALTNASEFALVTVWDTVNLKGQVAVIALGGTQGYWGDWGYPGLTNLGNFSFIKLLGFVDLPGMMAPTEISASGDNSPGWYCAAVPLPGTRCLTNTSDLPLSDPLVRASFRAGGSNEDSISRSGVAVILSKTEKKAIFLDLKPLFAKVSSMYFSDANYAKTTDVGQADTQWPYAFTVAPDFAPTVITTMAFDNAPTAVRNSIQQRTGFNPGQITQAPLHSRSYIATVDGTLHFIDLAGYANHAAAVPGDIKEVGTQKIGKNTTSLAYMKHDPTSDSTMWKLSGLIATSRAECRIDWLLLNDANTGASVIRSLQDSRLVDPIAAEDNDASGGESYVLSVADYGGRQISNYRFGKVQFGVSLQPGAAVQPGCPYPAGCPLPGNDPFEFGGAYAIKGKPFIFTEANTP